MYITSTLKISSKSIQSSLRNRPDKKWEKNNKNNNKKPYNNYKVFRLKRKTLIITRYLLHSNNKVFRFLRLRLPVLTDSD